jgi:hypothetical protein
VRPSRENACDREIGFAFGLTVVISFTSPRLGGLRGVAEVDDVAVEHDVLLAFEP